MQISDENLHHVQEVIDEVFGPENFVSLINFVQNSEPDFAAFIWTVDYLIWYARDKNRIKYRQLFYDKGLGR